MLGKILMILLLLLLCTFYNGQTSVDFWLIGVDVNTAERTNSKVHSSIVAKKSFRLRERVVFDGSIEHIKCITEHTDYIALSNNAVLLNVAPLLKNKDGTSYRGGVSEN